MRNRLGVYGKVKKDREFGQGDVGRQFEGIFRIKGSSQSSKDLCVRLKIKIVVPVFRISVCFDVFCWTR